MIKPSDLENWNIDVEDGVRLAKMAIDAMRKDSNPLVVTHALLPYLEEMPPQMIGFMQCIAEEILNAPLAAPAGQLELPREIPALRLVQ